MKDLIKKWWLWVIIAVIILMIGIAFIYTKFSKQLPNIKERVKEMQNSIDEGKILVMDNETKEVLYLNNFKEIKQINDKIIQELGETLQSYEFDNMSADKYNKELVIRDISKDRKISYRIRYNIATNELEQIVVTNFEEWSNTSSFIVLSMKVAELTILNFNEKELAEIWNNIKNNKELYFNTEKWKVRNVPKIKTFSIEKND